MDKEPEDATAAAIRSLEKSLLAAKEVEISVLRQLNHTLSFVSGSLEQIANHLSRLANGDRDR